MAWTTQQNRAIHESGYNIIDSAGAGSGKTAVLSERVKYFVTEKGYRLSEFLILTFTNLAAAEMKDRIRKKLEKANSVEAENVDSSDISSIDSFFHAIVKKYHYLIGVSSDMGVIDDGLMTVTKYKILDDIFNREYEKNSKEFSELIGRFCFKDDWEIRNLIISIQEGIDLEINKEDFYNNYDSKFYNSIVYKSWIESITNSLRKKRDELKEIIDWLPNVPTKKGGPLLVDTLYDNLSDFFNAESYNDLVNGFAMASFPSKPRNNDEIGSEWNYLLTIKKKITDLIDTLPKTEKEFIDQIEENRKYANYLIEIAHELDVKQYEFKVKKQVFSFQDIAKMALNLVKNNENVREEIKNKYKMIMIDEYQDTSDIQEEIISSFINDNAYMVGDVKQSIYAFRNAKCEIFSGKYEKYKNHIGGEVIDMNKNFRSREEVLSDINDFFSKIMTSEIGGADYKKDHLIEFGLEDYRKGDNEKQNNHSEFITYDQEKYQDLDKDEIEARIIAEDIIKKINSGYTVFKPAEDKKEATRRPCEFKDFCILMETGNEFDLYKKVFTEYQIPLFVEKDEDIKNNAIVKILKNILYIVKAVNDGEYGKEFILAYLSLARSFIFRIDDETIYKTCKNNQYINSIVFQKIRDVVLRNKGKSNYEILDEIIYELDIYHKLVLIGNVEMNSSYLDEFRKKFKGMSSLDYDIDDFIMYLDKIDELKLKITLPTKGSTLNSVKIMNIHKSKGLEFPIVYFPYLTHTFNSQTSKRMFFSAKYGVILPVESGKSILKKLKIDQDSRETLSEKIRLLYVALTRTREKMIFILPKEKKEVSVEDAKSFDNLLRPFMNKYDNHEEEILFDIKLNGAGNGQLSHKKIQLKTLSFSYNLIEEKRASKEINLSSDRRTLEYGTYLHEIMEAFDFENPDYSFIKSEKTKEIVRRFLSSPLMQNINIAKIYHEYEFESGTTKGFIDLFLVYEDHIDLIDYKTMNIEDTHYDEQIKAYREFLLKKFNKEVRSYLYALGTGEIREVK